ncbi:hypothetical protein RchiOBHm_Chr2g0121891 [Rosa chinensis]|uniref:Uncharacterized protein n=1 Tax=Rosa chinensis TaxID=74649 RepID=A0A2P6RSM9_ROSCH|nr:hypothetical protein RchiOBHm_Chr2g0121891 [Rosa chinensis]
MRATISRRLHQAVDDICQRRGTDGTADLEFGRFWCETRNFTRRWFMVVLYI